MPKTPKNPTKVKMKGPVDNTTSHLKKLLPKLKELDLKPKQIAFIAEYATNGFNARQAYIKAGYTAKEEASIDTCASTLLSGEKVRAGLKILLEHILEGAQINLSKQLFDVWFMQAFYDPSWFYNPDGSIAFGSWDQVPPERRICIESMEVKFYGKDAKEKVLVLKLVDRKWSQDRLDRYIQMTKDTKVIEVEGIPDSRKTELGNIFSGKA